MNPSAHFDVAIIGGGPAGLATAMTLIQAEPAWADRLAVLERAAHPRPKLCAGGITGFGLAQLRRLGLNLDVPYVPVREARFRLHRRWITVRGQPIFVVTRREELDSWLARKARAMGVRLLEGEEVQHLQNASSGVLIRTSNRDYLARSVVGADGSRGRVRRWVLGPERPPRVARLLEVVTPAQGTEPEYAESFALFDFTPLHRNLQGYYWDFPSLIEGHPFMNRGVYDARLNPRRPRASLQHILGENLRARRIDTDELDLAGHPIHWFTPFNRFCAHGVLLVGDAAGVDPLFGEGIGPALGYAQPAAAALRSAFRRDDFSFRDYPRRVLVSPVGRYLLLRWWAAEVAYRLKEYPLLLAGFWSLLTVVARAVGETRPPPGLPKAADVRA